MSIKDTLENPLKEHIDQLDCTTQPTRASSTACRDTVADTWHERNPGSVSTFDDNNDHRNTVSLFNTTTANVNRIAVLFEDITTTAQESNHGFVSNVHDNKGGRITVSFQNMATALGIEARFRFKMARHRRESKHGFVSKITTATTIESQFLFK